MKDKKISNYMSSKINQSKAELKSSDRLLEDDCEHSIYEDDSGLYRCITCNKTFEEKDL